MSMSKIRIVACPICKKTVPTEPREPSFPFCSVVCKNIDLGRWLDQRYAVDMASGKLSLMDEDEEGENTDSDEEDPTFH